VTENHAGGGGMTWRVLEDVQVGSADAARFDRDEDVSR